MSYNLPTENSLRGPFQKFQVISTLHGAKWPFTDPVEIAANFPTSQVT